MATKYLKRDDGMVFCYAPGLALRKDMTEIGKEEMQKLRSKSRRSVGSSSSSDGDGPGKADGSKEPETVEELAEYAKNKFNFDLPPGLSLSAARKQVAELEKADAK